GDRRVDDRDVGVLHGGQHGGGGGGSHRYDDVHLVGHQVRADLVQVGLVGLGVGVVVGIVEGDAPLGPHLVQAGLQGGDDLVEGSVVHIVDDAHLVDGGALLGGSRAGGGGSRRRRGPAAGQSQGGAGGRQGSGLQKAAAGDHLSVFHGSSSFLVWERRPAKKARPAFVRNGPYSKTTRPRVLPQGQDRNIRFCGATLFALPQRRASRGEPTLPCPVTGDTRPKLLGACPVRPALGDP